ncbi:conserved hypothetical protein, partial [Trichinella spiralis]|uniref:hypothetical protein n=1 Tax=Trichinella spiralis TaxID=6334 RepID=UPI0001EFD43D
MVANEEKHEDQDDIANLDTFAVDDIANEEKHKDQVVVVANLETEKSPSSSLPASTVLENAESQSEVNANEKKCGFSFDNPPHLINERKDRSFLASCCRLEWTKFFQNLVDLHLKFIFFNISNQNWQMTCVKMENSLKICLAVQREAPPPPPLHRKLRIKCRNRKRIMLKMRKIIP